MLWQSYYKSAKNVPRERLQKPNLKTAQPESIFNDLPNHDVAQILVAQ